MQRFMLAIHLSSMLSRLELLSSLLTAKLPPLSWRMFLWWWWWWWWWRLCSSRSLQCLGDCHVSVCVCVCVCVCKCVRLWMCVHIYTMHICMCVCVAIKVLSWGYLSSHLPPLPHTPPVPHPTPSSPYTRTPPPHTKDVPCKNWILTSWPYSIIITSSKVMFVSPMQMLMWCPCLLEK